MNATDPYRNWPLYTCAAMSGICAALPLLLGWLIVFGATREWGSQHTRLGAAASTALTLTWFGWIGAIWVIARTRQGRGAGAVAACLMPVVASSYAPVVVRALLPWEEPGTGMGSPMAVLVQLVLLSVLCSLFCAIPIAAMTLYVSMSLRRRRCSDGAAVAEP